jgi:hypothetical protein
VALRNLTNAKLLGDLAKVTTLAMGYIAGSQFMEVAMEPNMIVFSRLQVCRCNKVYKLFNTRRK